MTCCYQLVTTLSRRNLCWSWPGVKRLQRKHYHFAVTPYLLLGKRLNGWSTCTVVMVLEVCESQSNAPRTWAKAMMKSQNRASADRFNCFAGKKSRITKKEKKRNVILWMQLVPLSRSSLKNCSPFPPSSACSVGFIAILMNRFSIKLKPKPPSWIFSRFRPFCPRSEKSGPSTGLSQRELLGHFLIVFEGIEEEKNFLIIIFIIIVFSSFPEGTPGPLNCPSVRCKHSKCISHEKYTHHTLCPNA